MRLIWVLMIVLLVAASPAATQAPDDALIVPGTRIGKWSLDMTVDDLIRANGQGDSSAMFHPAYATGFTIIGWGTNPLGALTKDRKKIDALSMTVGEFKTEKGIGVGSARGQVATAYGSSAVAVMVNATATILVYDETGTGFNIDNDRVSRVWVFRSRSGAGIWDFRRQRRPAAPPSPPGERIDRY